MDTEVGTEIESVATLAQVGRHNLGFSVRSLVPPFPSCLRRRPSALVTI